MKTKTTLLAAGILLSALLNGLGQPVITTQPQDQTNYVGTTATLTAVATGTEPVSFQWQKYSTSFADLAGRTNAVLSLTNVQTNDAGDYRVVVTDATGTTNSAVAHLSVALPETLFISRPAADLVTLTWSATNWVLVRSQSLECPAWVRVYGSPPITLPVRAENKFYRLVALPLVGTSESHLDACRAASGNYVASCEKYVAAYLLNPSMGGLSEAFEAADIGNAGGSCISAGQQELLIELLYQWQGP